MRDIINTMYEKLESQFADLASWVYTHRFLTLAGVFFFTCALASQLTQLTIDTREESFFHDDDPTLVAFNEFRDQFGQDDTFFIALQPDNGISPESLSTLYKLHAELEEKVPYLEKITSLVNGRTVMGNGDTLLVDELMPVPPSSVKDLKDLMNTIDHYPIYENLLISKDKSLALILIKAKAIMDTAENELLDGFDNHLNSQESLSTGSYLSNEQNVEIYDTIQAVIKKYRGENIEYFMAGNPVFVTEIQRGIETDLEMMIPLSFGVIIICLAILFRRISGVIYPLITVFLSLTSTLGIMAFWEIPITNAIQILPTFLIVVGIGDSVHILTIFYRNFQNSNDKRQSIIHAVGYAGLPILMTSITTACGLLSFIFADVAIIAQLGYVAPIGVMLAFFYTIFLLPALIAIFPMPSAKTRQNDTHTLSDRIFDFITKVTTQRPLLVTAVSSVIVLIALVSAFTVRFSHNAMTWLPKDSPARVSTELMDHKNGGTVMLEVLVDSGKENGLHDPDLLARLDAAAQHIPTIKVHDIQAGKATSLADVLKETNRALHKDRDEAYKVPDNRELIAQELILFESSGSDDLEELVDGTYQTGRLSILAPFTDSILYRDYTDEVEAYLHKQFPMEKVTMTGHMALFIGITKLFITSMAKSYISALIVISGLMIIMIGSVRVGLLSMTANVIPIILVFGIMGFADIPLDMATILIGSIILGLVVDDTLHFLHHFRRAFQKTGRVEAAIKETLTTTGRALLITSIVLCGGFFIYTTSFLANNVRFGVLSGCAVIFAIAADFFLIPALLTLLYKAPKGVEAFHKQKLKQA